MSRLRIVLGIVDFILSMIGMVVLSLLFWHAIGFSQLVVCYGRAPVCDAYVQVQEAKP